MKFRILLANCAFAALLWAAFWVVVTLITVVLGLMGRLTHSAWEVAAQLPRWYALFVGVALVREYLPLYVAHGRTRRQFGVEGAITIVLFAPFLSALLVLSYLLESVLYGVAGWPHVLERAHMFTEPTQVPLVFAEYLIELLAWTTAGAFMGAAFYRFGGGGLLSVPVGVLMIAFAHAAMGVEPWGPFLLGWLKILGRITLDLPDTPLMPLAGGAGVLVVGLLLTWAIIRDMPLRNQAS
ncbi:hypothetical protein GCM10010106_13320 [Thermopolyspora flexuosa]|jgi:hypothetical protein|uniref:Uncharacterized protein n=1 Tax=Thermopolyspora flexuosa TaxID=103836 RepID=A0A543IQ39_9ACTN|nr:hypothetical protein [Thermopolyspora flexuosa]TQM72696.1 hypothetical protein FHX40_4849 [Thermopolyspora flexuosa]GGM68582.1 hypothetical protein GCM10010106_13320 [Thermopolyspora flexuosa]